MRRAVAALEYASRNDLAWLILRVTQKLSPCSKTSLIAYISGGYTTSPTSEIIFDALLRLEALALIQIAEEQIAITDKGRRFLDELAVDHLSPRTPFAFLTAPTLLIGSRATTLIHSLRALLWNAAKASGATPCGLALWAQSIGPFWRRSLGGRNRHCRSLRSPFDETCRELTGRSGCIEHDGGLRLTRRSGGLTRSDQRSTAEKRSASPYRNSLPNSPRLARRQNASRKP